MFLFRFMRRGSMPITKVIFSILFVMTASVCAFDFFPKRYSSAELEKMDDGEIVEVLLKPQRYAMANGDSADYIVNGCDEPVIGSEVFKTRRVQRLSKDSLQVVYERKRNSFCMELLYDTVTDAHVTCHEKDEITCACAVEGRLRITPLKNWNGKRFCVNAGEIVPSDSLAIRVPAAAVDFVMALPRKSTKRYTVFVYAALVMVVPIILIFILTN